MKNAFKLFGSGSFILLCFLLSGSELRAAEKSPISVKAEVDSAFITIGDPVDYTVTVKRNPDVEILSSITAPPSDIFKIKKIDEFRRDEDGQIVSGRKIALTSFRLGDFILDPVKIRYRVAGGEEKTITTNPLYITVQSVAGGEEQTDIRGVKTVLPIPSKFVTWLILTIVFAALVVGAIAFYLHWKNRPIIEAAPERLLTPEEEALQALTRLFESELLKQGKIKAYYLTLSEILRIYFEKHYGILAVESTTYEITRDLKQKSLTPALRAKIQEVLEASDLAKFAKWKPEPAEIIQLNKKSKEIVEEAGRESERRETEVVREL